MQDRTCPTCGNPFTPSHHNQRFCPPSERDRKRSRRQPRSRCARAWQNAQQRGVDAKPPVELLVAFDCAHCHKHCVPGQGAPLRATKYCSLQCKRAATEGRSTPRERAERRLARAAEGKRGEAVWYHRCCPECGDGFLTHQVPTDDNGYCGSACRIRQKHRRRRARLRGCPTEHVSFRMVAQRDGWSCGICGETVDPALPSLHRFAPTLDHVIPLSRGGSHTMANAQLAHMICNALKSDRIAA